MKVSHFSIFMINTVLTYSAPQISEFREQVSNDALRDSDRTFIAREALKHNKEPSQKKNCCSYNFDSQKCQIVNDRKLCGYNMNSGGPGDNPAEGWTRLDNRCWFRRGRVECGYVVGPYDGIRRPPIYDVSFKTRSTLPEVDKLVNKRTPRFITPGTITTAATPTTPKTTATASRCKEIRKTIVCGIIDEK